jgi:hypothetical protein
VFVNVAVKTGAVDVKVGVTEGTVAVNVYVKVAV